MTEEELQNRIGSAVLKHMSLKAELTTIRAIAKVYVNLYLRINGALQDVAPAEPIDWSEYPTADEIQNLIDDLNSKKKELEAVKVVARQYGVELE